MQGQAEDQGLPVALAQLFVKVCGDHAREVVCRVAACQLCRGIVDFDVVRNRKYRARTGGHPERLVVRTPVQQVTVTGIPEQVGCMLALGNPGTQPAARGCSLVAAKRLGSFPDQQAFLILRTGSLFFGIGAAVADELISPGADTGRDLRGVVVHGSIHQVAGRQVKFVEQVENTPDADAQAVIPPGIIAHVRRGARVGRGMAQAFSETEMLDIQGDIDGQPLAVRPVVVCASADRGVGVPVMGFQFQAA